jgi:predicted nucleic acid-binding protein
VDAFDSDVLIYAAIDGHPLGERIRGLIVGSETTSRVGSSLLVPELLIKPLRDGRARELQDLVNVLAQLTLLDIDQRAAELSVDLGARYGLNAADALHLATGVLAGADRFVTNNRRDFKKEINEIDIVYPDELPASA